MRHPIPIVAAACLLLMSCEESSTSRISKAEAAFRTRDYAAALHEVEPLAAQGNPQALGMLGWLYLMGNGVRQSDAKALSYFYKGSEAGDAFSAFGLASMYVSGDGVPRNIDEAAKWFRVAAERGYPMAMYRLSVHLRAIGEKLEAFDWLHRARLAGVSEAVNSVRWMIENESADGVRFEDGLGDSIDSAITVIGATGDDARMRAEQRVIEAIYPMSTVEARGHFRKGRFAYDRVTVRMTNGAIRSVFFRWDTAIQRAMIAR